MSHPVSTALEGYSVLPPLTHVGELQGRVITLPCSMNMVCPDLLERIFSYVTQVKEYRAVLFVCRLWRQVANHSPQWQTFFQHRLRLEVFFKQKSLTDRKSALTNPKLKSLFDRAESCHNMLQKLPRLSFEAEGFAFCHCSPSGIRKDLGQEKILCRVGKNLNFLDLEKNTLTPFPLDDFLRYVKQELHEPLRTWIARAAFDDVSWLNGQYLIFPIVQTDKIQLVIAQKNLPSLVLNIPTKANETACVSDFKLWNSNQLIVVVKYRPILSPAEAQIYPRPPCRFATHLIDLSTRELTALPHLKGNILFIDAPYIMACGNWFGINTGSQIFLHSKNQCLTFPQDLPHAERRVMGILGGALFTVLHETNKVTLRRHFLDDKLLWNQDIIPLSDLLTVALSHEEYVSTLFDLETVVITSIKTPQPLIISRLRDQRILLKISDPELQGNIKWYTLIGDLFLFTAKRNSERKLYAATLGSQQPPRELPIPLNDMHSPFFLYRNKLIIQEKTRFRIFNFGDP